jgi:RimJ/RimL family protein N-acetyltransferase
MPAAPISTARLDLVPATPAALQAALDSTATLAAHLQAVVPSGWPPEYLDAPALQFTLDRLSERPHEDAWWMYFILLRGERPRTLVGVAGYKGPPTPERTVEIGYGIVPEQRRRGYATEAARALIARAFDIPAIDRVLAETLPELEPSIGVLHKCGFRLMGEGSEPGVIRFELARSEWNPRPTA